MSTNYRAMVVGASAGAVDALGMLIPSLPANFTLPVFIVVHLPPDRPSVLAEIFQDRSPFTLCEAEDKEPIEPRHIYFAPPSYHLLVETPHALALSNDEPVWYSRPSIDLLFESAADAYGDSLIGVILTGANEDGAAGLRAIGERGGVAIVQDPEEAASAAMPKAALKAWPQAHCLRLSQMGAFLEELLA